MFVGSEHWRAELRWDRKVSVAVFSTGRVTNMGSWIERPGLSVTSSGETPGPSSL